MKLLSLIFILLLSSFVLESKTHENNTQTDATLKSLKLTLEKNSLNVDENITLKVIASYQDNTTKDITKQVEWILSDTNVVEISQNSLYAKKDINIFIQAKLGTVSSNTLALEIYKEINGHRLPPEPDPTINNATLLGIDSNNNGVRDDVERWIYTTYNTYIPCVNKEINVTLDNGTTIKAYEEVCEDKPVPYHQIVREIAMQGARASQIIIQEPEKARETTHLMDAAQECNAYFQYSSDTQNQAVSINHDIISSKDFTAIQFNTVQRARAYAKYNFALSGGVYPSSKDKKSECDFNVDKLLVK